MLLLLYHELGGGSAGIYWHGVWLFHPDLTDEAARRGMSVAELKPPDGSKKVPLGKRVARCQVDGKLQEQTVTVMALTAEPTYKSTTDKKRKTHP